MELIEPFNGKEKLDLGITWFASSGTMVAAAPTTTSCLASVDSRALKLRVPRKKTQCNLHGNVEFNLLCEHISFKLHSPIKMVKAAQRNTGALGRGHGTRGKGGRRRNNKKEKGDVKSNVTPPSCTPPPHPTADEMAAPSNATEESVQTGNVDEQATISSAAMGPSNAPVTDLVGLIRNGRKD